MNRNNLMTNQTFLINWWQEHDGYMLSQVEFNDPPTSFTRPSLRGVLEILRRFLVDSFPYIFLKELMIIKVGKKYRFTSMTPLDFPAQCNDRCNKDLYYNRNQEGGLIPDVGGDCNTSWETGRPCDSCLTENIWFLSLDFYTCHKQYNHPSHQPPSLFHK